MTPPRAVTVTVDALVLHGVPAADTVSLGPAVEGRLAALIAERGLPGRGAAATPVPHDADARMLADGIAAAIWAALPGGGR